VKKLLEGIQRLRSFLVEVVVELKKSSWPTRNELVQSTAVVILSVVLFSAFIGLSDAVLGSLIRLIVR
jgi:preprotein translocase subunit SecE